MTQTPFTYTILEQRISAWAAAQPPVRAVLSVGSRARGDADRWSDLDIIILTSDRNIYASSPVWLGEFGEILVTYAEPTDLGDPEWYAVYQGGIKLDAVLIQVDDPSLDLASLMQPLPYQGVFGRGINVLFDRSGEARTIPPQPFTPEAPPSEAAFANTVSGLLMASLTTAKFISRGDYWRAQNWFAQDLRPHLLTMLRWHAHGKDTWYGGRFMEQWADPRALAALPLMFPAFERESLHAALLNILETFRWLGEETAARFGYTYPSEAHNQIAELVRINFFDPS
jgi:aminoglycoside 6-adenylyltransferase